MLVDPRRLNTSQFNCSTVEVVGETADGQAAVAVFDVRIPLMDGIRATAALRDAGPRSEAEVLILTTFDDGDYVYRALRAGASRFLLNDAPAERIVAGVRTVARGDALLHQPSRTTPHR